MLEELLSNDRRVKKHLTPPGFELRTTDLLINNQMHWPIGYQALVIPIL